MAKAEKILRVNIPFRVLPDTLKQLQELAEADSRTPASMMEKMVKDLYSKTFPKKKP